MSASREAARSVVKEAMKVEGRIEIQERGRKRKDSTVKLARENRLRELLGPLVDREGYEAVAHGAFRFAKRTGMRNWKSESNAVKSLQTLMRDACVVPGQGGATWTGHCVGWVLDIFDAYYLDRAQLHDAVQREPDENATTGVALAVIPPEEFAAEVEAVTDDTPPIIEPVAECAVEVEVDAADEPLSSQLLEAYLNRDAEAIMAIALEVERLER